MLEAKNDRTADFFHHYAGGFNAIYGNMNNWFNTAINTAFRGSMRERFERSVAGCTPTEGATVLDVGCGPGHYGVALAKRGVKEVVGLDFASGMLDMARENARRAGVESKCSFLEGNFMTFEFDRTFDFSIYTGFMDYMRDPVAVVKKAAAITNKRAFFSFPSDEGFLAWQRKMRYKLRCDLYLYSRRHVESIMQHAGKPFVIDDLGRDYFVTLTLD